MDLPWGEVRDMGLRVVLPAFAASLVVTGVVARLGARGFAAMFGVIAGFAASNHLRDIVPWTPQDHAWHWLPVAMLAAMIGEYVARYLPARLGWVLRIAVAGYAAVTLVGRNTEAAIFAAAVLAGWAALTVRPAPVASPLAVAGAFLAAAAVLIHAHSARLSDLANVIGFALLGVGVVSLVTAIDPAPVVAAGVVALAGLMLAGLTTTFSDVPASAFFLAGLAPVAGWASWWFSGRWAAVVRVIAVMIPAGIAVTLAVRHESLSW